MATLKAANSGSSNDEGGFFSQMANEVLDSAEKLTNRLEEGLNAILTGDINGAQPQEQQHHQQQPLTESMRMGVDNENEFMEDNEEEIDWSQIDMDTDSPLNGIAENVVGNIMQRQVRKKTHEKSILLGREQEPKKKRLSFLVRLWEETNSVLFFLYIYLYYTHVCDTMRRSCVLFI